MDAALTTAVVKNAPKPLIRQAVEDALSASQPSKPTLLRCIS